VGPGAGRVAGAAVPGGRRHGVGGRAPVARPPWSPSGAMEQARRRRRGRPTPGPPGRSRGPPTTRCWPSPIPGASRSSTPTPATGPGSSRPTRSAPTAGSGSSPPVEPAEGPLGGGTGRDGPRLACRRASAPGRAAATTPGPSGSCWSPRGSRRPPTAPMLIDCRTGRRARQVVSSPSPSSRRADPSGSPPASRRARHRRGHPVTWQLPTRIETVVASFALSRLGAVQNPIIQIYREREVGFCIRQTGAEPGARARHLERLRLRRHGRARIRRPRRSQPDSHRRLRRSARGRPGGTPAAAGPLRRRRPGPLDLLHVRDHLGPEGRAAHRRAR
jgi:hypothetical protein